MLVIVYEMLVTPSYDCARLLILPIIFTVKTAFRGFNYSCVLAASFLLFYAEYCLLFYIFLLDFFIGMEFMIFG